jgi:hypothetical protein
MNRAVLTFCVTFAVLYVVIRFDEWWQRRNDPPAGPSPHTPSPQGQRLSGSAGAARDELMP